MWRRPKRKQGTTNDPVANSTVGKEQLKQAISARKHWRLHQGGSEAQRPLRTDQRIRRFERAVICEEPKRMERSLALNAAGTSTDTYTTEQLIQCSLWTSTDLGTNSWCSQPTLPISRCPMTLDHRDAIHLMHAKDSVHIAKVTDGRREFTVKTSRRHDARVEDATPLCGWSDSGSLRPCYDRCPPKLALVSSATFNGRKPEEDFVGRACPKPPEDLLNAILRGSRARSRP